METATLAGFIRNACKLKTYPKASPIAKNITGTKKNCTVDRNIFLLVCGYNYRKSHTVGLLQKSCLSNYFANINEKMSCGKDFWGGFFCKYCKVLI